MEEEIDRFEAVSDDGEMFTVIVYQELRESRSLTGSSWSKGLPRLFLSDGKAVNEVDPETFKIVETNQIIRKVR